MPADGVSVMVEDYLKVIWAATEWDGDGSITTTEIATTLKVGPSSVSGNLKKLSRDGLIRYEPYGAIELSDAGRSLAVQVVRRHRLIETYLAERLGFEWDEVHAEADLLEHAVSDRVLDRLDDVLGHPARDPHGDPIPTADGVVEHLAAYRLSDLSAGGRGTVARISDRDPELLRYLDGRGIRVGVRLRVESRSDAAGVLAVSWGAVGRGPEVDLSLVAAAAIRIEPDAPADSSSTAGS